ncbi:hypothetical protein [Pandoraea sputorum]|uniref:hypothetical protein n=1 Tax=Pandoraea sputorum TaxID=93222 RepID=UPI0030C70572
MLAPTSTRGRALASHFAFVIFRIGVRVIIFGIRVDVVFRTTCALAFVVVGILISVGFVILALFCATALLALRIAGIAVFTILVVHLVVLGAIVVAAVFVFSARCAAGNSSEMGERKPARREGANTLHK